MQQISSCRPQLLSPTGRGNTALSYLLAAIRRAIQLQNTATELFYKKQKNINVNIRIILVAFEFACQLANSRKWDIQIVKRDTIVAAMCDLTSNKRRRFNEPMFQLGVEDAVNETTVLFKVETRWKACPAQLVNQWGSSGGRTLKTSKTCSHTFHPPPSIFHIPLFCITRSCS